MLATDRPELQRAGVLACRIGADAKDIPVIEAGILSGYPDCCIFFFMRFWLPLVEGGEFDRTRQYLDAVESLRGKPTGYIPCPHCAMKGK